MAEAHSLILLYRWFLIVDEGDFVTIQEPFRAQREFAARGDDQGE
jgi:hypothetical protein